MPYTAKQSVGEQTEILHIFPFSADYRYCSNTTPLKKKKEDRKWKIAGTGQNEEAPDSRISDSNPYLEQFHHIR